MGKQISFYMDDKDEKLFIDYVLNRGCILFEGNDISPQILVNLPEKSCRGWFKVILYNKCFGELKFEKLSNGFQSIKVISSPVIDFSRTIVRESGKNLEISAGRLWVEMKYYGDKGEMLIKSKELNDWFMELSTWIKKNMPKTEVLVNGKNKTVYMSGSFEKLMKQGYILC